MPGWLRRKSRTTKGNEPFGSVADPDPDRANQTPARANAVAPPTAMPKVATAAAANYSTTETSGTETSGTETPGTAASRAAASGTAAATSGLCGRVSGRDQETRYANGGQTIDAEQRGCCQTARQEFPSSAWFFPGHFIALPYPL